MNIKKKGDNYRLILAGNVLIRHYTSPIAFLLVGCSILLIYDVRETYGFAIFSLLFSIILFLIQYRKLRFTKIHYTTSKEKLDLAILNTSKELEWELVKDYQNKLIFNSSSPIFTSTTKELITIVFNQDYILVNSICDPEKNLPNFSSVRNKENIEILKRNIKFCT
jgi:hypothetical protein